MKPWGSHSTKILFLTKYVCNSSIDFMGPIGERYAGLYYSFMESNRLKHDFYWYTGDGETFEYEASSNTLKHVGTRPNKLTRFALARVLLSFCITNWRSQKLVILSYPNFPKSLFAAILLMLLKPFRLGVVVDVQDLALPRETPWTVGYLVWWITNEILFVYAHFIFNATECARAHDSKVRQTSIVIPMAAHHHVITPGECHGGPGLTLAYVGSVERRRGFPELVDVVRRLRAEGLLLDLVINGGDPANIIKEHPPWLQLHERQPLRSFADVLRNVDVGVITYLDREYWSLMSITKMASYMAAGLPIICLRLTETSNILEKWECGLSAEDWVDFEAAIKALYKDKSLRIKLAKNAREAAVQEYNWLKQSQRFANFIEKVLTGGREGSGALARDVTFGKDRDAQSVTVSNETRDTL